MRFAVETWAPEYGIAADSEQLDESTAAVDVAVEMAAADWRPVDPLRLDAPACVVFVDGVRRIDVRVWITADDLVRPAVCASVAAGAVRCDADSARVVDPRVFRGVYAAASDTAGPIVTHHGTYEFVPCADDTPEGLYNGIHDRMTLLETQVAAGDDADVVVFDGPLRGRTDAKGVGFIKTQHVQYLPDDQQRVLAHLDAGQRSPVFLVGGRGFTTWSWYLRLPGPISHPLSGIVRCELPGLGTADDAVHRAHLISAMLPRYASEPHKDSRAPQNLYPIAGLEHELRRRLGDPHILERALRRAAAQR